MYLYKHKGECSTMSTQQKNLKDEVKEKYGSIAARYTAVQPSKEQDMPVISLQQAANCCGSTNCCEPEATGVANMFYEASKLADLPDTVTGASLGCGNPTAIAGLKPDETVLDLGSGGGIDCFLAAKAVGPTGHVIGVDMTDEMLKLANQNKIKLGVTNVEFRKGEIENIPVEDNTVDIIISNCVINLSPDKGAVFREAFRVLKPGGRFAVSDIVTEGEMPEPLRKSISAWVGCISGALDQEDYLEKMRQVGFVNVTVESRTAYGMEALDSLDEKTREDLFNEIDVTTIPRDTRIFSANIVAYKPGNR
jgi:SAM-dependent methyltransferase